MLENKSISVVVPAYNESKRIVEVIHHIPDFVDSIIVIDDASQDKTAEFVEEESRKNPKVHLIKHKKNQGVGAAILTGYTYARDKNIAVTTVVAGDGQMDTSELQSLCMPVIKERVDYVKGNRLIYEDAWKIMPKYRFIGNSILTLFTKIASGYWFITDTQTGYTAISLKMLKLLNLKSIYPRYGFPNDMFVKLNVINAKIKEIPIRPIYHADGKSGIKLIEVVPKISFLLLKGFFWRLKEKYIIRDFHPLVFFYFFSFLLAFIDIILVIRLLVYLIDTGRLLPINSLAIIFVTLTGLQFLLFAMWFDMDNNRHLRVE